MSNLTESLSAWMKRRLNRWKRSVLRFRPVQASLLILALSAALVGVGVDFGFLVFLLGFLVILPAGLAYAAGYEKGKEEAEENYDN